MINNRILYSNNIMTLFWKYKINKTYTLLGEFNVGLYFKNNIIFKIWNIADYLIQSEKNQTLILLKSFNK